MVSLLLTSHIVLGVSIVDFKQVNNDLKVALNILKVDNEDSRMITANIYSFKVNNRNT